MDDNRIATLTVPLRKQDAGLYANLFYYDPDEKALEFVSSAVIDANGNAKLDFCQASDYAIIIDDHPLNSADADAIRNVGDVQTVTDDDKPAGSDVNPHTGAEPGGLALLTLAGAAVLLTVTKKRK